MNSLYKKGMISTIALMSLLLLALPTAYAQEPQLSVQPTHTDVDPVGGTFAIEIWLNVSLANVTDLYGWQVKLGYNTTILNATDAGLLPGHPHEGKGTSFSKAIEDDDGYILVLCAVFDLNDVVNVTENKPLCYINFTTTEKGTTTLEFLNIGVVGGSYMLNKTGHKVPFVPLNGDVTVIPEFMHFVALMFMVASATVLILLKKRWTNFLIN